MQHDHAQMPKWPKTEPEVNSRDVINRTSATSVRPSQSLWQLFQPNLVQSSSTRLPSQRKVPNSTLTVLSREWRGCWLSSRDLCYLLTCFFDDLRSVFGLLCVSGNVFIPAFGRFSYVAWSWRLERLLEVSRDVWLVGFEYKGRSFHVSSSFVLSCRLSAL